MATRTRLHQLADHGQSVWIDFLSRDLLESGIEKFVASVDQVLDEIHAKRDILTAAA